MKGTIERLETSETYTTWFGLGSERTITKPFVRVTIHFSEEEKEIIKRAPLDDYLVYEHPADEYNYQLREEMDQARRRNMATVGRFVHDVVHENPRYELSRFVHHFLEEPAHDIYPGVKGQMALTEIEKAVAGNLAQLKEVIKDLGSRPSKREIEL